INDFPLAPTSLQIFQVATEMVRRQGQGLLPLSTSCLLFSLRDGIIRNQSVSGSVASLIVRYLAENARVGLEEVKERFFDKSVSRERTSGLTYANFVEPSEMVTPNVLTALGFSLEIAGATAGDLVEPRHVFAALLCAGDHPFGARQRLEEMGV